jgi:hypothetical protein
MAHPASGNVVPFGDHPRAPSRLSPKESADVLVGCRELAIDRMTHALAGMLDRVEDDLFDLADKAVDREVQNTYLDARSKARDKRKTIEATFRQHFLDFFNRKMRGEAPAATPEPDSRELTLVAHEELEERIAVREMARKLGAACEGELFALSQRMGFLLERPELADEANPVSPGTVFAALKDACDQIEAGFKVRMALLQQFERYAEADLQGVYHELNAHLVERRILPDVRIGVRRAPPAAAKPAKAAPVNQGGDLFGTLAQLISPNGGAPATGPTPQSFMAELTRMHRDGGPEMSAADEIYVNVLRNIKSAPQNASLSSVDAMTIDIVAMLFDYIFEDRHIPATVKALLGRLQIPTLKVALLDKGFFATKMHPARRLLDLLAESAIGLDESNAAGSAVVTLIEGIVQSVLHDFETDQALFDSLVQRVEAFIEERKAAEDTVIERSARVIEERERSEIARVIAAEEISRRLALRAWVPVPVREMLLDAWIRALAQAQSTDGEGSPAWQSLLQTMEDLLWSVEPKVQPEDRKRLVTMLPALLKHLLAGLARAAEPEAKCDEFLGLLVDCHAAAVKSGLRGIAVLPDAPPPAPEPPADPSINREMVPAGDIQVAEIRLKAARGMPPVRNIFTRTGIWTNLQRGTWVEFAGCGGPEMRARLTWISPNKGVYLFTNPLSSAAAISISPEALAEQMRLGDARMLDDAPLVDRAVDSMIANLRRGAA